MNTASGNGGMNLTPRRKQPVRSRTGWPRACMPGLFFLLAAALPPAARAATLVVGGVVDGSGAIVCNGGGATLASAINGANNGDEIVVCPGAWTGTYDLSGKSGNLTIRGATGNPGDVILSTTGNNRIFIATGGNLALTLKNMTLSVSGSSTVVDLTPASEVPYVFENLVVESPLTSSADGFAIGRSSSIVIRNTTINTGGHGIYLKNSNRGACLLESTQIRSGIYVALYSLGSSSITMNGGTLFSQRSYGVYITGGNAETVHHFTGAVITGSNGKNSPNGTYSAFYMAAPGKVVMDGVTVDAGGTGVEFTTAAAGSRSFTNTTVGNARNNGFSIRGPGDVTMESVDIDAADLGVAVDASAEGTHRFTNMTVKSGGTAFRVYSPGDVTMKNVVATPATGNGVDISNATGGAHDFTGMRVESAGRSFHIDSPGNVIMRDVEMSSSSGYAVYLGSESNGDHLFEKVTASSPTNVMHILESRSVTMRDTELTSTAGHALYLGPSAIGNHFLENVKLKSTNATGVHMEASSRTPRSMTMRNVTASTRASTGIYILDAEFIDIVGVTASSNNSNAMYLRTNSTASGTITVKNGSLDAGANGMDIGTTSSAKISNVCVTHSGSSGIYAVSAARNVTIENSLFEDFGYRGVNMHSPSSYPATVTNNIFLGTHPFAYSASTDHNFDGNYWQGVAGGMTYQAGNAYAIDHSTLGAPPNPPPTCHTPVEQVHHFRIEYASEGLTCAPETVTVTACANEDCTNFYTGDLALTLSGQGATSVVADGAISGGTGKFSVRRTTVGGVVLGIASSSPSAANGWVCFFKDGTADPACTMNFVESALKFYHSDGTNVLPGLPNLISAKPSGPVYLRALKADPADPQRCAPGITGERTVDFRACYQEPETGTMPVNLSAGGAGYTAVNTAGLSSCGSAAWTPVQLDFGSDAEATLYLRYDDAGKMNLRARYQGTASSEEEGLTLEASDSFIARPAGFCVQRPDPLTNPVDRTGSCTATNKASCAPFVAAGDEFDLLVRAAAWEGDADADFCTGNAVTPNYRNTSGYEAFNFDRLKQVLEAPLPGKTGDLAQISQTEGSGKVVKTLTLSEVGVFHFEVEHDYMGAGVVKGTSVPIGRFIPARFELVPIQQAGCSIATPPFTYAGLAGAQPADPTQKDGQPFEVSATIQALNRSGVITRNYYGDFMRLVPGDSAVPSSFTAAAIGSDDNVYSGGSLSAWKVTSLNMAEGTNPVTDLNAGTGDMTGQAKFIFNALNAPADIAIRITATDTDGVTGEGTSGLAEQRIGRMVVGSAHSHLEDVGLTLAAETQFYDGTGYVLNDADVCTDIPVDTIDPAGSLVDETGLDSTYVPTVSGGHLSLPFTAPGKSGFVDATISVPEWLRYDWDGNGTHDNDPTGRASWGLFRGSPNVIRLREVWQR